MKTERRFLALAAALAALAFTLFACSSDSGGDPSDPGVSSSEEPSSSSSSSGVSTGGSVVSCGPAGEGVKIGEQCWLKKNLDILHSEGKGESWCYGNDEENCEKYGRLYNWAAAMDLPGKCNSAFSTSDEDCAIASPKHQGLCPEGFHLPTNAEWDALYRAADGTSDPSSPYDSPTAGSKLKAAEGWDPYEGISSTDEFGFSALPGGYYSYGSFYSAGSSGDWWSASEFSAGSAYSRHMNYSYADALWGYYDESDGFSVRCLQD